MIKLFGFQAHDAPGEAEAECALLQQAGIVDAVLSEDVDTIMFGCTRTLRNWSSEGTKGSKSPTHVSLYDTEELQKGGTGLDREGMVLVALMSGGDYLPEGIPGAGVKLACEAARAGFGKSLCRLKKSDSSELASWKEWLTYELRHNESGFFRTRHKALSVPDSFPNLDVLRYYTHPVVSPTSTLDRLRNQSWDRVVDVEGLREFVRETFDWTYRIGAVKFIRVLAPCLLVQKMMARNARNDKGTIPVEQLKKEESELVTIITSSRTHFSTDATPELRLSFIPTKIVGYDFQEEPDEVIEYGRDGLALNSDDEFEALAEGEGSEAAVKGGNRKVFTPTEPDLVWIPETIARLGIPITTGNWEEARRAKTTRQKTKAQKPRGKVGDAGAGAGALDKFVKVSKNITRGKDVVPAPSISEVPLPNLPSIHPSSQTSQKARRTTRSSKQTKPKSTTRNASPASRPDASTNPWTIAGSQNNARVARANKSAKASETITISSSPPASPDQDRPTFMSQPEGSSITEISIPPSSPPQRSATTPTGSPYRSYEASSPPAAEVAPNPPPRSSEKKLRRKLARTESLPVKQNPQNPPTERSSARHFTRARTVAVEAPLSDFEEDSELDLPPLSAIIGKLPGGDPSASSAVPRLTEAPDLRKKGRESEKPTQATLDSAFSTTKRTTKMFMPRKSEPGFFREVEIEVDEADDMLTSTKAKAQAAAWRLSDVSCIDLTCED